MGTAVDPFPSPDLVIRLGDDLRYRSVEMYRDVPTTIPLDHFPGRTLSECLPLRLVWQVLRAADQALEGLAPVEIRYNLILDNRLFVSHARITANPADHSFLMEVIRPPPRIVE